MKKIMCVCLTLFITLNFCYSLVSAQSNIALNVSYDGILDALKVSGYVYTDKISIPLMVKVTKGGIIKNAGQIVATTLRNGKVFFEFAPLMFAMDAESGVYDIYVSGNFVNSSAVALYNYIGVDLLFNSIKKFDDCIDQKDKVTLSEEILTNGEIMSIDPQKYSLLSPNGKNVVLDILIGKTYDIPSDYVSDKNKEQIKKMIIEFRSDFEMAIAVGSFCDISSKLKFSTWDSAYFSKYGMGNDDLNTAVDERILKTYYDKAKNIDEFITRLTGRYELKSIIAVRDEICKQALLTLIKTQHFTTTERIITDFPTLFPYNTTEYQRLSAINKTKVYPQVAGGTFYSYDDVVEKMNSIIHGMLPQTNEGSNLGNNNSSNWGSPNSSNVISIQKETQNIPKIELPFTDLASTEWVRPAVTYLFNHSIIQGKESNKFEPEVNVTKAEFVKMLIVASNKKIEDYKCSFEDVSADDWYYKYISAAEKEGILKGNEKNEAEPDKPITRQDVAVIIKRILNDKETSNAKFNFDDVGKISEYALDSIFFLVDKGIMKGMGNNRIEPLKTTTRAEIAQLIYNAFKVEESQ